jgi:glucosamine--fructose-6-phosphate aminotransferase (isomerizing)
VGSRSGIVPTEIFQTPEAVRATLAAVASAARDAAAAMRERAARRMFFVGNGTSHYTGLAASYTARALAGPEDPLFLAVPAGDFRHLTPALGPRDAIIGMSASGEFRDVLAVFDQWRGRCLRIGITQVPGSSLARLADVALVCGGGPSHVPVMTKTYATTLTAAHLLVLEYFGAPRPWFADLAASADRCAEALRGAEAALDGAVDALARMEHAFYFGAGGGYAAALEGALKMKEMALLHAEGSETWEMASGPATMVSTRTFCVALYSGGPADEGSAQVAGRVRAWGAPLLEIGPRGAAGHWQVPVAAPAHDSFASLALVPVAALLAYRVARARGLEPDAPAWRERYRQLGMTHLAGA